MTSAGDGEILSRRELRARHPELFQAPDIEGPEVDETSAASDAFEAFQAPHTPMTDATELAPVLVGASATSAAASAVPAPAAPPPPPPPPAPPAVAPPAVELSAPPAPAAPAAPRPFTLDLPPAPDWTTVSSPVVPPTIDVSAWRPTGPQRANTAAVWWIVVLPLLGGIALTGLMIANPVALQIVLGVGTGFTTLESLLSTALWLVGISFGVGFVVMLLSLLIGFRDRAKLQELGHQRTASPWWMLLATLIYLIIRTVHTKQATGRGSAPLVVWILLYIAPSVFLTIVQLAALFV